MITKFLISQQNINNDFRLKCSCPQGKNIGTGYLFLKICLLIIPPQNEGTMIHYLDAKIQICPRVLFPPNQS